MSDALQLAILNWGGFQAEPGSPTNFVLDAANDGLAWACEAHGENDASPDAITHIVFRYGVRTGTPPQYIAALEGIDGGGMPDGTVLGGGTASGTFTPPADATWNGTLRAIALATPFTPTRGQRFFGTVRHSAGTVDGANNSSLTRTIAGLRADAGGFPYAATLTTGTWAINVVTPCVGFRTASGRLGQFCAGAYTTNTAGTAGNRSAMHFTLPADWGDTFKVLGIDARFRVPAAGTQLKFFLRDASTELQAATLDSDQFASPGQTVSGKLIFDEATLATLSFGAKYYAGFEVVGTAPVGLRGWQLGEADDRKQFPNGENRGLATDSGGGWVEDNTVFPMLSLILADWTKPSGVGFTTGGQFNWGFN